MRVQRRCRTRGDLVAVARCRCHVVGSADAQRRHGEKYNPSDRYSRSEAHGRSAAHRHSTMRNDRSVEAARRPGTRRATAEGRITANVGIDRHRAQTTDARPDAVRRWRRPSDQPNGRPAPH